MYYTGAKEQCACYKRTKSGRNYRDAAQKIWYYSSAERRKNDELDRQSRGCDQLYRR